MTSFYDSNNQNVLKTTHEENRIKRCKSCLFYRMFFDSGFHLFCERNSLIIFFLLRIVLI